MTDCSSDKRHIHLSEQERLFERRWKDVVSELIEKLNDQEYLARVHDMALTRLRVGYKHYGDTMYRWSHAVRERNMDEEVADYIAYGTSAHVRRRDVRKRTCQRVPQDCRCDERLP